MANITNSIPNFGGDEDSSQLSKFSTGNTINAGDFNALLRFTTATLNALLEVVKGSYTGETDITIGLNNLSWANMQTAIQNAISNKFSTLVSYETTGTGNAFTGVTVSNGKLTFTLGKIFAENSALTTTNNNLDAAKNRITTLEGYFTNGRANSASTCTGNAATATKLATARTIGGVSFDGSANIDLPGVNAAGNQSTSGNAATATKLKTARTIGGVSFDGTSNINLPGVNTAGNQNTSGKAATAGSADSATKATNIAGGAARKIPYQTAADTTGFIDDPGTSGTKTLESVNGNLQWLERHLYNLSITIRLDQESGVSGDNITLKDISTDIVSDSYFEELSDVIIYFTRHVTRPSTGSKELVIPCVGAYNGGAIVSSWIQVSTALSNDKWYIVYKNSSNILTTHEIDQRFQTEAMVLVDTIY